MTTDIIEPEQALARRNGETPLAAVEAVSLLPVPQMQAVLAEYDERRRSFRAWLLSQLEEGVHYGVVPGTEAKRDREGNYIDFRGNIIRPEQWRSGRPSLYKAGADFLCDLLMLDPSFEPDAEAWRMLGSREGTVVMRCRLLCRGVSPFFPGRQKGEVAGEGRGVGEAGEKKRNANAAVKIAQKSAKVDAVIHALGLSDLFTQDIEPPEPRDAPPPDPTQPRVPTRAERQAQPSAVPPEIARGFVRVRDRWKQANPKGTKDDFAAWAKRTLRTDQDMGQLGNWTVDVIAALEDAL
jgi:hypothetical protein